MTNITPEEREALSKIGKLGGQSTSEAKKKASRENLKKALEAKKLNNKTWTQLKSQKQT